MMFEAHSWNLKLMRAGPEILAMIHYMFTNLIRGLKGFNQVRIARTIRVSRGDPSASYSCAGGVQYNLI